MKIFIRPILAIAITSLTLCLNTYADNAEPIAHQLNDGMKFNVNFSLKPDGREWKLGSHQQGALANVKITMQQFLPDNQPTQNPAEFFLLEKMEIDTFPQTNFLDDLYKMFTQNFASRINENFPNSPFQFKVLSKDKDSLLAEFNVNTSELKEQGWFRIIITGHYEIAVLLYSTRELDKVEAMRKTWIAILEQANITSEQKT